MTDKAPAEDSAASTTRPTPAANGSGASAGKRAIAAVLTALVVTATTHVANLFAYFVGNGLQPTVFAEVNGFFWFASVVLFVLLTIAGLLGAFRNWYAAGLVGLVGGILAGLVGTAANVAASGTPFNGEVFSYLFTSLISLNLIFIVFATIATLTIAPRMYRAVVGLRNTQAPGTRHIAVVRLPANTLAEGQLTHQERTELDTDRADAQWDAYVSALDAHGWRTVEAAPADDMPDSVFIEDAAVMFDHTAVITNPGAVSRRGEIVAAEEAMRDLGLDIARIEAPGTLEGGDVLKVGTTVYVGRSTRTNAEGIRQLRTLVAPLGYSVVTVPVTRALHLKTAATALPDGTVIGYAPSLDNTDLFDRFLAVPEPTGASVLVLDASTVLMAASAPKTAAMIVDLGYTVVTVDISEFEKLEGSVTCLSVRVR